MEELQLKKRDWTVEIQNLDTKKRGKKKKETFNAQTYAANQMKLQVLVSLMDPIPNPESNWPVSGNVKY